MTVQAPIFIKKVKCPQHFLLRPGAEPFVMELNPAFVRVDPVDAKRIGLKLLRRKKDINGQWIMNRASYYQPELSAAYIHEKVYNSNSLICQNCRRCVNRA